MPIPLHCDGHTCPLADHLPDIVVCYDAEGRRTYVSPEYCRIFGIGPEEVIGRRIGEFIPPAVAGQPMEQLAETVHRVIATGKPARCQIAWSDAGGRHLCYELLANPTFDAAGGVASVLTVSRDISEIRETTDRLILLDFALNRVHEALYIVDEEARFVLVNDEACRALGYSRDEFRAMRVFDIDPDFPPQAWTRHWEELRSERARVLETQHRTKDGRFFPVEILTKYFRYGSHAYNLALARDISDRQRADEIKRRHRGEFEVLVQNSPDTVVRYDRNCIRIYANPAYVARAGKPLEAVLGRRPSEGADSPALIDYERCLRQIVTSGQGCEYELCWKGANGKSITCLIRLTPEFSPDGRVAGVIAIGRDISALKETQKRLERAEALAHVGHWEWDYRHRESFLSAEACRIFGHEPGWRPSLEDVLATVLEDDRERILQSAREAVTLGVGEVSYAYRVMRRDGKLAYLHSVIQIEYDVDKPGYVRRLIGTTQDVTKLKTYEYHVHDLTYTDMLTSLPNRTLFIDRARHAIAEAQQHGRMLGVMLVDLDRFKAVNDGCGHAIGDAVLVEVGQRLRAAVRGYDTVARLSGDEFAILLPNISATANLARVSQKIFDSLALPIRQKDKEIFVTPSIGIAVYPDDAGEIGTLLQYADAALGHAKERGRSRHSFYTRDLTAKAHERVMLEAALRQALRRDELCLHYQPQIDLASGDLFGFEALMRWQHPEQGMIPPIRFIPVAEHTGLITAMGEWALATAFRQVSRWNRGRDKPLRMAVNLSSRQFGDGNLAERIFAIAEETGCQPAWVELEITESLLLDGNEDVRQTLHKLAEAGYSIAIDDFGTGYSALGYLHRFPIHTLKIDRSFINGLVENCRTAELVKAILSMAHALHLTVVAEGIEHRGEEAFVQAHGGQIGQGYLYSKPQAAEYFEKIMAGRA